MQYSVGDKIRARINKIQETGCFCSFLPLEQNQFGFMPNFLMPSCFDENGHITKKIGDEIVVVINKITEKGILLSDMLTYEKEMNRLQKKEERARIQALVDDFVAEHEVGDIFEVEVIKVEDNRVIISLGGGVQGVIRKEDINWNVIDKSRDSLFVGEMINAVFLGSNGNQLLFSIKYLNEKPYEDKLYNLALDDLLKYIGHTSNVFIGQARQYHYGFFIDNLYSADDNQKGKLLIDPIYGYNLRAVIPYNSIYKKVEENKYYRISLELSPKDKRIKRNQLFQFIAKNIEEAKNPYKADVYLAFQRNTTNPASNQRDAKLLDEIGGHMYSSKDRMFFELIQNADDAASRKGVLVNVKTCGDYLILMHNGYSFDKDDFVSITTAANGTKKANENKTGYKGIGFKSVFTDSIQVYINTGGYRFKFDRNESIFQNFDEFYLENNPMIINDEAKYRFIDLYSDYKKQFDGIHSIPWQLEPIWVEEFPMELGEDFTSSNVAIALKLGNNKIEGNNGYRQAIEDIISNPKFMLFLRNTKRIDFNGKYVSKTTKDGLITLKNSFGTNRVEYFKRKDFDVPINNEVFASNGIDIRVKVDEKDESSGKIIEARFVDLLNQELENIPKKIAINHSTSVSFAIPIKEDGTLMPNKECKDISMFAFLPTLVKDFKFPFYINANFILDPPRQRILGDNPWNFYLMQEIAKCMVCWCALLNEEQDKNALNVLVLQYFNEDSADTKQLAEHFNTAYKSALESEAFILNHKGRLSKQSEIILDKTKLSEIVGAELFCELIKTNKFLPSNSIDSKVLSENIFKDIETLKFDNVIDAITNNLDFNDWYIIALRDEKQALYKWINDNNTKSHEEKLKELVSWLPLFQFGDLYKSYKEIESSNLIVTTEKVSPIKEILHKLGFECSDNLIDISHPLYDFINKQNEEELFNRIKKCNYSELNLNERHALFCALKGLEGVGEIKLKEISLFKNKNGEFKSLGGMAIGDKEYPFWLNSFLIDSKELCLDIENYLISSELIFQNIIQSHFVEFKDIPIADIYDCFIDQWTPSFTNILIAKYGATEELLGIVERTDASKHFFIEKFGRIDLSSSTTRESVEYRVIKLALSSGYSMSKLKSLIYIDNISILKFTISDEVVISISRKEYHFSLSNLLPNQFEYESFNRVKDLLSDIQDSDSLFSLTRMASSTVKEQLKQLRTPEQCAFFICYNVANNIGCPIRVENDEKFVSYVLSYCYENNIDVLSRYIQYFTNQKIIGKFINCDDVTIEEERLSLPIRNWADCEDKEKFLISLGVKGPLSDEIRRRKAFVNNEPISLSYSNNIKSEIIAFLNWCITFEPPYVKDNQIKFLKEIFTRWNIPTKYYLDDYKDAKEWSNDRYFEFVKPKLPIYCINTEMPKRGVYRDIHLFTEYVGNYFWQSPNPNTLYVNVKGIGIDAILLSVSDDRSIPVFTKDDWTKLFMVSVETLNEKEKVIAQMDETIRQKDEIIEQYRAKFGELTNEDFYNSGRDGQETILNSFYSNAQDEINSQSGRIIKRDGLSHEEQIAAHQEAERVIKEKLESDGYDCSNWTMDDEQGTIFSKWHSVNQIDNIISPEGEVINLVIKSVKGGYIYLSAADFEFLTLNSSNVLMVWDGRYVHSVTAEDIFNKDSNVNLIFDTEYTPKHYYAALSKVFQYVKRTTFAVKNPSYYAYDSVKSFGMDSKTEGVQDLFDDNDL